MRPNGVCASTLLRRSPWSKPAARTPSVSTMPGVMALTRILLGTSSFASLLFSFSNEMLDICLPGELCPHGHGLSITLGDLIHHAIGSLFTGSIVNDDCCTFSSELFGDVSADSLRSAGHDRDFSV